MLRDRGKTMFDATDLSALDPKYFSIIFTDAFDVTIMSRNTGHYAHPAPSFDGGIAMSFYRWILKKHINTMAPVGDLARDMKEDSEFPRDGGKKKIRQYLEACHACSGCMDAFDEAWAEYARERS
jgi:uncharacterized protein YozE (UPF0346 family)